MFSTSPLRELWSAAGEFLYPSHCPGCGRFTGTRLAADGARFCEGCRRELTDDRLSACLRCGGTIGPNLPRDVPCHYCRHESFAFDHVYRLGVYDAALRRACLKAKGPLGGPLATDLALSLCGRHAAEWRNGDFDVVTSVPVDWWQRLTRSTHSAEKLGRVIAAQLRLPFEPRLVRKIRRTPPQARLTPTERRFNLRGAFACTAGSWFAGAHVLLCDDVLTTGSTAHEVARTLKKAGAARVDVAVVARGLGRPAVPG